MNLQAPYLQSAGTPPDNRFSMTHAQRLFERWLRRWGYALSGLLLGLASSWGMGVWVWPELGERHAAAAQTVLRLQAQLAALPVALGQSAPVSTLNATGGLDRLPAHAGHGQIWTDWQHVLQQYGLRLESLQPVNATDSAAVGDLPLSNTTAAAPPTHPNPQTVAATGAATGLRTAADARMGVSIHTAALQIVGRFEDWARLWFACADWGPVCAIDRIKVEATSVSGQVQMDVVLRLHVRAADSSAARSPAGGGSARSMWEAMADRGSPPPVLATPALFRPLQLTPELAAVSLAVARPVVDLAKDSAAPALANLDLTPAMQALSPNPDQWPLAHVRWQGLWQQGTTRWAIVSAGAHWAKVSQGQQVTSEGHRVEAITAEGVHLRIAGGPLLQLDGKNPSVEPQQSRGEQR